MKKLAFFLGALFVVGTGVQAKEVVVVVPTFKPSGYVGVQYKVYGDTEGHGDKIRYTAENAQDDNQDDWNRGYNKYSRIQTTFGIQATEKFYFDGRIRDYNNLQTNDEDKNDTAISGTETRLRAYYDHNDWFTSRVQYRDEENNSQNVSYQARFTVYKNTDALLSKLVLVPNVYHSFPRDGGSDYLNSIGVDIEYSGNLPFGFTWDGAIYLYEDFYGQNFYTNADLTEEKNKEFVAEWELYLYKTVALCSTDSYSIDFNFEGGIDPYTFAQYNSYSTGGKSAKTTYSLYALLTLDAEYKVTENVSVYVGAGAEYRNWDNMDQSSASHWRWQPVAYVGMETTF